ncbi:MAG TPA: transglutaminaseTgpA domain-containing protein [Actinomycetota bacterium]
MATALAFGRVFTGRQATLELVAAALASVAIAALFERRGLLLATIASLVGLAFAITWIVLPQTAWYGLPSIQTLRAVGRSLEFVGQQARVRVAPTPALPPLMLAAVTAVWTAAFSSHALAIRAGSPLLAILPPIALVGFADTVLEDGARPFYAIVLLAAALAVVFADGVRRVRQWGPVWSGSRTRRLGTSVRGSRPVAFAVIAAAVLVPGLLPGFRSDPLVDFSTAGDEGAGLDPFISIHAQLTDDAPVQDLFEVKTSDPQYWRLLTLDEFDGAEWRSSDPDGSAGQTVTAPAVLPQAPGFDFPVDTPPTKNFTFRVLTDFDNAHALPMAQTPVEITAGDLGDVRWDPTRGQAFLDGGLEAGLEYGINSRVVVPTAAQLDQVQDLTAVQYGRWTELPTDLDPRIEQIAHDWTQGEDSDYDKVLAIQQHFHTDGFRYDPNVEVADDADALLTFLTQTKAGFCQQYATTMAVLVRELGLPARIAIGYQAGTARDDGTYLVQSKNAHAWVEVFFEGYGWLQFEPTPGHGTHPNAEPGTYLNPGPGTANPEASPGGATGATGPGGGSGAECVAAANLSPRERQLLCQIERKPQRGPGDFVPLPSIGATGTPDGSGYSVPYRLIFLGLLILLGVFLVVVPIAKSAWRRRLLRRSREPREHVLAAYRVFDGEAADLGLGRREGETLDEHRARLAASIALTDGHLGRLTTQTTRAAYAAEAPTPEEARSAVEDAHEAIRELRKDAGLIRRIVGTYRPGV